MLVHDELVQIYARDLREIPEWIKKGHSWHNAVPFEKLQVIEQFVLSGSLLH